MNLLEFCLGVIAPHTCFLCGQEGAVLCDPCRLESLVSVPSRCYRCHMATRQSRVCSACRRKSPLSTVWVATRYHGPAKELIRRFKFERAKQARVVIAEEIHGILPILPDGVIVSHIPTANARVRVRGYDQAQLIAKKLCAQRGWSYAPLLSRRGAARQLGAKRGQRFAQLEDAFVACNPQLIAGARILLVDDVLTTGATVESAARTLKAVGAKSIEAVVFAQP